MKISKLFHWLYAILMLLPVFFIGVRCAYTVFNKNAKDSYGGVASVTTSVQFTQSNNFEDANLLFVPSLKTSGSNGYVGVKQVSWYNGTAEYNAVRFDFEKVFVLNYDFDNHTEISTVSSIWKTALTDSSLSAISNGLSFSGGYTAGFTGVYLLVSALNNKLDNAFEYSVNQLNEVPLFSWAKDSFLVQPFSYITGLFGLESTSPINTMLSYWLSISIIWLVFDLVMYVPLLVHRWLDKGVLE